MSSTMESKSPYHHLTHTNAIRSDIETRQLRLIICDEEKWLEVTRLQIKDLEASLADIKQKYDERDNLCTSAVYLPNSLSKSFDKSTHLADTVFPRGVINMIRVHVYLNWRLTQFVVTGEKSRSVPRNYKIVFYSIRTDTSILYIMVVRFESRSLPRKTSTLLWLTSRVLTRFLSTSKFPTSRKVLTLLSQGYFYLVCSDAGNSS